MYWPTSAARVLTLNGAGSPPHPIIAIARSRSGAYWASLTAASLTIWSTRPCQIVAAVHRTQRSIDEYGANTAFSFKPDGSAIIVETDASFALLYDIVFTPSPGGSGSTSSIYSYTPSSGSGSKSAKKESYAPTPTALRTSFQPEAGELVGSNVTSAGSELSKAGVGGNSPNEVVEISFRLVLRIDAGLSCALPIDSHMLVSTLTPPAIQAIPWPDQDNSTTKTTSQSSVINEEQVTSLVHSRAMNTFIWITEEGRAYSTSLTMDTKRPSWRGKCFHGAQNRSKTNDFVPACKAAINARFSLLTVGLEDGTLRIYAYRSPTRKPLYSHSLSIRSSLRSTASFLKTGKVTSLAWTSDGYALAVGFEHGWAVWSTYGKLMASSFRDDWASTSKHFSDSFMFGVQSLFWGPCNSELFILSGTTAKDGKIVDLDRQLFALPFARSAVAGQQSPDNTRYAFVQLDDAVLVYRGSDQPDMSIINPESDVWSNIKIPQAYLALHWPIRYASISNDGRLIAVAGRRGLTHYSAISGRWKRYVLPSQESSFSVRGGLQWYQHVLIAACDAGGENQIRLYSRDLDLDNSQLLHLETLPSPIILTSLFDNSLLVYTADNTFYHFLIAITKDSIKLELCGSITFEGVVGEPTRVRGMSWMIPKQQQLYGNPADDLIVATVIFLIDGKLVLLRPRQTGGDDDEEVAYDMQILADRIEYYWTHLQGIGSLENSLWGYDGHGIKLWLDALTIEQAHYVVEEEDAISSSAGDGEAQREHESETAKIAAGDADHGQEVEQEDAERDFEYKTIRERAYMPLDFYPLCVAMEKGIIIGIEPETSIKKNMDCTIFKSSTNTHLFLQHVLRHHLQLGQLEEAIQFGQHYAGLTYFAHALEILLHSVLEDEADNIQRRQSEALQSENGEEADASNGRAVLDRTQREASFSSADSNNSTSLQINTDLANGGEIRLQVLPTVIAFLQHFSPYLSVVVGCARKTEVARWKYLFATAGEPKELFARCLELDELHVAASYLLVLHTLEPPEESTLYSAKLLQRAMERSDWRLCRDLMRFLSSVDEDGQALAMAVQQAGILKGVDWSKRDPTKAAATIERVGTQRSDQGERDGLRSRGGMGAGGGSLFGASPLSASASGSLFPWKHAGGGLAMSLGQVGLRRGSSWDPTSPGGNASDGTEGGRARKTSFGLLSPPIVGSPKTGTNTPTGKDGQARTSPRRSPSPHGSRLDDVEEEEGG
ncbi:WD40 repeat protein [Tilletia horrida]|uniref:WD40 repeat protein n=1 Tax=Tilletia horrida TaxID=155126 RepID=A0AAN6GVA1_9BASI|nr:WD40 repeat protein [Tilletia horrida]